MKFQIISDDGDKIRGYVAPDNPSGNSRVALSIDGRRVKVIEANHLERLVKRRGWHATGECGFIIDAEVWPGLAEADRLELHDVETNLLIHRRVPTENRLVEHRAVLINTGIESESDVQEALFPHFRQSYFGIHAFSEENAGAVLRNTAVTSFAVSGAFLLPRLESNLPREEKFLTMLLIHDPFVELARRILWLWKRADIANDRQQSWRLGPLAEAASFMGEWDPTSPKSMKRMFRSVPESAFVALYNPLTRQLGTRSADDRVLPGTSIAAVERLARIDIVGHHVYFAAFMMSVFDRLGIEAEPPASPSIAKDIRGLAEELRTMSDAREMLHFDTIIADEVVRSISKSWGD